MTQTCPSCGAPMHPGTSCFTAAKQPADFAEVPVSIGELRADRHHSAAVWSPRDALVQLLREIDSGQIRPTALVVTMAAKDRDGDLVHVYRNATPDNFVALGLLSRCAHRLQEGR